MGHGANRAVGHGAWGIGHWAWGMGHGAWGYGHGALVISRQCERPRSRTLLVISLW
ncbi:MULTISPECIES: hypothetical protein [unclassified Microcoleus]|uniref:hypothetical protein n=1 Tax=Microcoleus sp. Aus8_D3 TaxID=2818633 RepID=UPI002FCEE8A3